jgi:hypothetical protein
MLKDNATDELIRENGWVIDPNTGEVVGVYGWLETGHVENEHDLWILQKKILEVDSLIVGEKAQLKRIQDMCAKRIKQLESRRDWMEIKYGVTATDVARHLLPRNKKTYTSPYGEITFRTSKPKITFSNQTSAVEWARTHAVDAVKTVESVLVSKLSAQNVSDLLLYSALRPDGCEITPEQEVVKFVGLKEQPPDED